MSISPGVQEPDGDWDYLAASHAFDTVLCGLPAAEIKGSYAQTHQSWHVIKMLPSMSTVQ